MGGLCLAVAFFTSGAAAEAGKTVGRVHVTPLHGTSELNLESVRAALLAHNAPAAGKRFPERRVISVRPRSSDPARFEATIYDSTVEKAFELVLDAKGNELSRKAIAGQPARTMEEFADASTVVRENASFVEAVARRSLTIYEPMPPVTVDAEGRRLVNVGVISAVGPGASVEKNEIVSVHIPTGSVTRYGSGAPKTANATLLVCGPPTSDCPYGNGPCNSYQVLWPAADPVWKLNIRHPSCSSSVQPDGTGLELTDVYYRGRLILKRAEVPVLNVVYANDVCGPFRDWLFPEDCFQAPGTDVPSPGSGVRVANAPPSTLCESGMPGSDAGNFRGVAIYDEGDALWIMTEMAAGWYRYIMEWRLHLDGTMEPIFGFGAVANSCTCNAHFHHAYWRMEWAVDAVSDGTVDDPATGVCTLEHRRVGTLDEYDPIATEGTFTRPTTEIDQDYWRIKNPLTGNGYTLEPGEHDGTATNDAYAKFDLAGLALNSGEIDDPETNPSINIAPWVNDESLGAAKRLVTWYHVTYAHDDPGGTGEACEISGPKFVPLTPCAGSISLDRSAYTCSSTVSITMDDVDLVGTGSTIFTATSGTESLAEPVALAESPSGSGHFQGTVETTSSPPINGDGKISVVDGDTIDVHYLDASACGTSNVHVHKQAEIDCVPPSITSVQAVPGGSQATIDWTTSEAASGVVHYGATLPTGSSAESTGGETAHTATVNGLSECSTYYYWVEAADAAGNVASTKSGGGYFAFATTPAVMTSMTSTDTPIAIPDNNPVGATSTIAVADPALVTDVNVIVNISHTNDRDLTLSLITPTNTSITLAAQRGGTRDNFIGTIFDDEAAPSIASGTAPFTGSFKPEQPLSAADGISAAGNWTLKAVDSAGQGVGSINSWQLKLKYPNQPCAPTEPPPVPDGTVGAGMTASLMTDSVDGVHLSWDAGTCPAENYHLLYGALKDVASYAPAGAVCGLGPLGSYDWPDAPSGDWWFLVVGDDTAATEGTWGTDSAGAHRAGATASGFCGFTTRNNAAACP